MRVSSNFSKAASTLVLSTEPEATRVRLKMAADGSIMFLPTSRKVVNNLPKEELPARKLTRDNRKNTLSVALKAEGIKEGIYVITKGRFNWFSLVPYTGAAAPLALPTVRFSKKSG